MGLSWLAPGSANGIAEEDAIAEGMIDDRLDTGEEKVTRRSESDEGGRWILDDFDNSSRLSGQTEVEFLLRLD